MLFSSLYPPGVYFQGVDGAALTQGRAGLPSSLLIVGRGRWGGRRVNTAPRPGPGEVAVGVPPWASINALEMIGPMSAPPLSRLRAAPPVEAFKDVSELARWDALAVIGDVDERGGRPLSVDANPDLPAGRGVSSTS